MTTTMYHTPATRPAAQQSLAPPPLQFVFAVLIALVSVVQHSVAQGFDWQYSAREPTKYPTLFVGVIGNYGLASHFGSLTVQEKKGGDTCFTCGAYNQGRGTMLSVGLRVEQWLGDNTFAAALPGTLAVAGNLRYEQTRATFSFEKNNGPWRGAPGLPARDVITRWSFDTDVRWLLLDMGVKYKLYPLPLHASVMITAGYELSQTSQQAESKVSPAEYPFQTVVVESAPAVHRLLLSGNVLVGADVPLARGLYASPSLFVSAPITNVAQTGTWRWLQYGLQIAIVYGWLPSR